MLTLLLPQLLVLDPAAGGGAAAAADAVAAVAAVAAGAVAADVIPAALVITQSYMNLNDAHIIDLTAQGHAGLLIAE